jgi:diphosphomevalonate decarboxylase
VEKDFATFATETMRDSNQFHAVCMDTVPPIMYLNDVSRRVCKYFYVFTYHFYNNLIFVMHKLLKIIHLVHKYNGNEPPRVAYTYDAGPNAVLYLLEQEVEPFARFLRPYIALGDGSEEEAEDGESALPVSPEFLRVLENVDDEDQDKDVEPLALRRIIYTRVGDGPKCEKEEVVPE